MAVGTGHQRQRRGGGGLLLVATLALLGVGGVPVVLCQAPGGHLAVEVAGRGCLPATSAGEDAPDGGCDACRVGAADGCSDSPVLLSAVLMGGGARVLPVVAPVVVAPFAAAVVDLPGWVGDGVGPDLFLPARSCVLRS